MARLPVSLRGQRRAGSTRHMCQRRSTDNRILDYTSHLSYAGGLLFG